MQTKTMVYQFNRVIDDLDEINNPDEIDKLIPLGYDNADFKCGLVEAKVFADAAIEMLKDKNKLLNKNND